MTAKRCLVLSAVFLLTSLFAASAFAGADIVVVRDWDGIEISNGGWYPFGAGGPNVPDTRRFRIYNSGTSNLIINNPTTFLSGNGFSIIATPVGTIHAGESTTFRVQFLASTPGDYYGAITFNTNDPDEDPYVIHLWGAVNAAPAPEIAVFRNWDDVPVPDGGSFTFPDEVAGISDSRRFRITNTGTAPLILGNPATLVSGPCFHQIETPVTPIAAGASGWFRVRILCNTPGTYTGTVSIQSDDADDNPYDFTVSGTVTPAGPDVPEIALYYDNPAVADGGSYVFPNSVPTGQAATRTFRIENSGTATLTIANPNSLVSGTCFSQTGPPPASSIAPGANTD